MLLICRAWLGARETTPPLVELAGDLRAKGGLVEDVDDHVEGVLEAVLSLLEILLCKAESLGDFLAKPEGEFGLASDIDGTG